MVQGRVLSGGAPSKGLPVETAPSPAVASKSKGENVMMSDLKFMQ
jgi:hypothetical protein